MIKFSGWHRLWIVVISAYLLVLIVVAYYRQPSSEDIIAQEVLQYISLNTLTSISNAGKDKEWTEVIEGGIQISLPTQLSETIEVAYKSEYIQGHAMVLRSKRMVLLENTILAWSIPSLLILAYGYLVNWVRRGFKK